MHAPAKTLLRCCAALSVLSCTVIAADAVPRSSSVASSGWVKSSKNPMLSLGQTGDFDSQNLFGPCVVRDGGKYFMFYCGGPAGPKTGEELVRYQIGLALSDDGETWEKTGQPLMPLGERDNFHATPSLLRDSDSNLLKIDGVWHMVFCGNRADDVEHATSRDGLTWAKDPRSPIFKGAYAPNLVQVGEELRMYYIRKPKAVGGQAKPWEVQLATGKDFYSLKEHPANPVLTVSQPWEKGALFYPCVLREDHTWVMFYASYWQTAPVKKQCTAIGMATSTDGIAWIKNPANPILTPTVGSTYDSVYTSSESVIRDGDSYRLYYAGRVDMIHKYFSIGMATKKGKLVTP
jgi:predicted GH43/DUF377 family glycosyl hydrolase